MASSLRSGLAAARLSRTRGVTFSRQPQRDMLVRSSLARAAGVALIEAMGAFEDGSAGAGEDLDGRTIAVLAFAARGRRLLRSAYRLIDVGERDAAAPLYRVMSEYLIVGRWLIRADDATQRTWGLEDLRERLVTVNDVLEHARLDDLSRNHLEQARRETEDAIRRYGGDDAPLSKRAARRTGQKRVTIEAMAGDVDLEFVYAYGYRLLSQTDVHASAAAADAMFDATEGGLVIRPAPRSSFEGHDPYLMGAHLLYDLAQPLADSIPELRWQPSFSMIGDVLRAIGRLDRDTPSDALPAS